LSFWISLKVEALVSFCRRSGHREISLDRAALIRGVDEDVHLLADIYVSPILTKTARDRFVLAADNARDARLLAGDNLSQEPMEQNGITLVTSAT
jgi:hypothetical protein